MSLFFAHDNNLWPLIASLNISSDECLLEQFDQGILYNYECPYMEFASNLVFEYFSFGSENGIRVAFNDKYYDVCGSDFIDKNNYICRLQGYYKHID